ncbi:MAG: hypothetical protein WD063_18730 [Pirellulales bacterium]
MIQSTNDKPFDDDDQQDAKMIEADRFLYDGHDFDPEAGLQYNRARHYDPGDR